MQQSAQLSLGVPSIKTLLDFAGGFLSLAPFLCMGIDREDYNLQIFPTMIFSFSICSLHLFPFLYGCCVNTLYKPVIGHRLRPFGKCFESKIDDENLTFILGERSQFGREGDFLDFYASAVYNFK